MDTNANAAMPAVVRTTVRSVEALSVVFVTAMNVNVIHDGLERCATKNATLLLINVSIQMIIHR